jgi:O-antigen/teichoic acid export membrane protein
MFWRGVLGYLPVNVVQAVAGFGAIVVFTRLLSPEAYGHYALAFSVAAIAHLVVLTWIETAMARFYAAEEGQDRADLFATLYRAFAVVALLAPLPLGLALVLAPVGTSLKLAVAAGLVSSVARSLLKLSQERRRAAGDVRGYALFDIVQTGAGFGLGALLAVVGFGAAAPFAGAGAASALCLVWALGPELKVARTGRFDPRRLRRYAAYGLPISMALILNVALASTDRFVLAAYVGDAAVGAYHASYSLSSRSLDIIFLWLSMAGSPAMIAALEGGGEADLRRTSGHQAALMLLIVIPATAGVALVAAPLAQLMVGPALAGQSAQVMPWIAVGALFSGLSIHYLNHALTLARRPSLQFVAIAIPAAANVVLCLVLIPRYGLDGAAWATAASYAVGLVGSFFLMRLGVALPVPWGVLARVGAATAVMAAVVLQLPALGGALELGLKAALGALVYSVCVLALDAAGVRTQVLRWLEGHRLNAREAS